MFEKPIVISTPGPGDPNFGIKVWQQSVTNDVIEGSKPD